MTIWFDRWLTECPGGKLETNLSTALMMTMKTWMRLFLLSGVSWWSIIVVKISTVSKFFIFSSSRCTCRESMWGWALWVNCCMYIVWVWWDSNTFGKGHFMLHSFSWLAWKPSVTCTKGPADKIYLISFLASARTSFPGGREGGGRSLGGGFGAQRANLPAGREFESGLPGSPVHLAFILISFMIRALDDEYCDAVRCPNTLFGIFIFGGNLLLVMLNWGQHIRSKSTTSKLASWLGLWG